VAAALEFLDEGTGEGVADDHGGRDPLPGADGEEVGGVEPVDDVGQYHRGAGQPAAEGEPTPGAVHQRRRRQEPEVGPPGGPLHHFVDGVKRRAVPVEQPQGTGDEVPLAPQDAFGHPGGTPGVEDVEVVGAGFGGNGSGGGGGQGGLVVAGAVERGRSRVVGHLEEEDVIAEPVADGGEDGREPGVVKDRPGPGVVEQVGEFIAGVAVVDVERRHPGLVGAEHALQVLRAVVEVEGEMVVGRLPRRGRRVPPPEAVPVEQVGEAAGPVGGLGPGPSPAPPHHAVAVGDGGGDGLVEVRQVELHDVHPFFRTRPRRGRPWPWRPTARSPRGRG
jgi:hypothetical protein